MGRKKKKSAGKEEQHAPPPLLSLAEQEDIISGFLGSVDQKQLSCHAAIFDVFDVGQENGVLPAASVAATSSAQVFDMASDDDPDKSCSKVQMTQDPRSDAAPKQFLGSSLSVPPLTPPDGEEAGGEYRSLARPSCQDGSGGLESDAAPGLACSETSVGKQVQDDAVTPGADALSLHGSKPLPAMIAASSLRRPVWHEFDDDDDDTDSPRFDGGSHSLDDAVGSPDLGHFSEPAGHLDDSHAGAPDLALDDSDTLGYDDSMGPQSDIRISCNLQQVAKDRTVGIGASQEARSPGGPLPPATSPQGTRSPGTCPGGGTQTSAEDLQDGDAASPVGDSICDDEQAQQTPLASDDGFPRRLKSATSLPSGSSLTQAADQQAQHAPLARDSDTVGEMSHSKVFESATSLRCGPSLALTATQQAQYAPLVALSNDTVVEKSRLKDTESATSLPRGSSWTQAAVQQAQHAPLAHDNAAGEMSRLKDFESATSPHGGASLAQTATQQAQYTPLAHDNGTVAEMSCSMDFNSQASSSQCLMQDFALTASTDFYHVAKQLLPEVFGLGDDHVDCPFADGHAGDDELLDNDQFLAMYPTPATYLDEKRAQHTPHANMQRAQHAPLAHGSDTDGEMSSHLKDFETATLSPSGSSLAQTATPQAQHAPLVAHGNDTVGGQSHLKDYNSRTSLPQCEVKDSDATTPNRESISAHESLEQLERVGHSLDPGPLRDMLFAFFPKQWARIEKSAARAPATDGHEGHDKVA